MIFDVEEVVVFDLGGEKVGCCFVGIVGLVIGGGLFGWLVGVEFVVLEWLDVEIFVVDVVEWNSVFFDIDMFVVVGGDVDWVCGWVGCWDRYGYWYDSYW